MSPVLQNSGQYRAIHQKKRIFSLSKHTKSEKSNGPEMSLDHLRAVHFKLVYLLKGLSKEQLKRTFVHPEGNQVSTLEENIGRYAWHGSHHFAHIKNLIDREGW